MSDNWHMGELSKYQSYQIAFDKILIRGTNDNDCKGVTLCPDWNIPTSAGWNNMKFETDIHGPLKLNPKDFGESQTFYTEQLAVLVQHYLKT